MSTHWRLNPKVMAAFKAVDETYDAARRAGGVLRSGALGKRFEDRYSDWMNARAEAGDPYALSLGYPHEPGSVGQLLPKTFYEEDIAFQVRCHKCQGTRTLNQPCPSCGHWHKYFEPTWVPKLQQAELARALDDPEYLLGELRMVFRGVLDVPEELQVYRWVALVAALLKHTSLPLSDLPIEEVETLVKKYRAPYNGITPVHPKKEGDG